jgi:hypothetical protein
MRKVTSRSLLLKNVQIALVAATVLAPSVAIAQWVPYGAYDPYGYGAYGSYGAYGGYGAYGYYGSPYTRYSVPSDQMHWYSRAPVDFNT